MKNITQYFMDTVKASDNIPVHSNNSKKKEIKSGKYSKDKYNYTTTEISNKNSEKDTCNMIESSSDIIERNSNPFKEINIYQTSKQYFSSRLSSSTKRKKLQKQHVDLSLKTNDVLNINKEQIKNDSINISTDKKHYIKKSKSGENINNDVHLNDTYKSKKQITNTNLLNIHPSDEIKGNHEESNAFQILMSHNNSIQCNAPIKSFTQNELNARKPEEHGEKFICSTEQMINEKRKCLKRKLSQVENEKVEKITQNPVKFLKREEKKDSFLDTSVLCQKQPSSNLLNYFSTTPVNVTNENMANISTIIVKADVHMPQNSIEHDLHNAVSSNVIPSSKRSKTSSLQFSEVDDIDVIESEIIDISNNEKKQKYQKLNKRRWSLRIKFQTYEDENTLLDEISDEELFSPKSKSKLNIENSKTSRINKGLYSENLQVRDKSNKEISKKMNEHMKLKLRKCEPENLECNVTIQNDKCQKDTYERMHEVTKSDKYKSTSEQNKNFDGCIIIDLEDSNEAKFNKECCIISNESNSEKKTTSKLAPIFMKQRKANQKDVPTKQLLAQTNVRDNDNKNINRQINVCNVLPFPLISHITQLTNLVCNETSNFNFVQKICNKLYIPNLNVKYYKQVVDFSEIKLKKLKNINKSEVEEVLTDIEKHCSDVKKMWSIIALTVEKHSNKTVSPKTKIRKSKQLKKIGITEHKDNENQIGNFSWTYKYRPKSTQEIVGNEKAAIKLREWLVGWKLTFINEDGNSEDEFYSSDSSYSKNNENQVAVLLGPHGSGKTASVYAIAEEFGYTVLELNASSKRTGKKLLKELEEATKSYQIKKKERATSFCNLASDKIIPKKISKNSLILIEDVDIIFEEDEGFISAMYQLALNTKRPIVMTCKDVCPHLNKLAPQQSRIFFQSAVGIKVSVLLELISLAETGYRLPSSCITELLQNGDLRKAILQLQYLLLSGPPQISEQPINFKNSFWQNMQYHVYRPAITVSKKQKRKIAAGSELKNNKNLLNDIANKLDNISLLTSLTNIEDPALNLKQLKMQPSLSLVENTALYSTCTTVCLEIAEWIGNKIMYKACEYGERKCQSNIILRKQLNKEVNGTLSHITSSLLNHEIIATDYLPSIRTMCRAEECRANTNYKRGNRYFHYLHNLKPSSLLKPNILTAACKMLCDKTDTDMCINKNNINFA